MPPTPNIPIDEPIYGYTPTRWICILFVSLFSVSTLIHIGQALRYRTWFMFLTVVVAGILEIIGWSGRLWSSFGAYRRNPFLMQIVTTIIGPTPLLAANFVILGEIIRRLGTEYSRLGPKLYIIVFCSFDFVSLIVQAVGGGIASSGSARDDLEATGRGGDIMLGGIVFQLFTIIVYVFLATEFFIRFATSHPIQSRVRANGAESPSVPLVNSPFTTRIKCMVAALAFNTLCLVIRAIYRTIELSEGWRGRIITIERYFNILDGAMILLAIYTLNIFHPGYFVYPSRRHHIDDRNKQTEKPYA